MESKLLKTDTVFKKTYELTFELTYEQDELIRKIGNQQKGGHEDVLPEFLEACVTGNLTEYLAKREKK